MVTLAIVITVVLVAAGVAALVNRREPDVPSAPRFAVPQQLDRSDFEAPGSPWLLLLFSSATCLSCIDAHEVLASIDVAAIHYQELPVESERPLHAKYAVDAVPTVVLADIEGVVRWSYLGAPPPESVADLLLDLDVLPPEDGTAVDVG